MSQIKAGQLGGGTNDQIIRTIDGKSQFVGINGITPLDKGLRPGPTFNQGGDTGLIISEKPFGYVCVLVNGTHRNLGNDSSTECFFGIPIANPNIAFDQINSNSSAAKTIGRRSNGTAWCWGGNASGQLGDDTITNKSSPVSVVGTHSFIMVGSGGNQSTGLKADGSVWMWGVNTSGQLGDNTVANKSSPISVVGGHSFVLIAGGHGCTALKGDGSIWCWGLGTNGELGDNAIVNRSSPVSVVGGHVFKTIQGGSDTLGPAFRAALKYDGTVWTWGEGVAGRLGDNTVADRSSPISVVGTHSFIRIAAGSASAYGLKADGTVWGWGDNVGSLGDNTVADRSSPVSMVGSHSFKNITGGGTSGAGNFIGLKADGSAWSCGPGGQNGDDTAVARSSPVSVVGTHSFINIRGGGGFSVALKSDGSIWSWGTNAAGQLGDNSIANRSSPVSVLVVTIATPTTPRVISSLAQGDRLIWNALTSNDDLSSVDRVDLIYFT